MDLKEKEYLKMSETFEKDKNIYKFEIAKELGINEIITDRQN